MLRLTPAGGSGTKKKREEQEKKRPPPSPSAAASPSASTFVSAKKGKKKPRLESAQRPDVQLKEEEVQGPVFYTFVSGRLSEGRVTARIG